MSYLFDIKDRAVIPYEETLLVEPFKSIWERDKSPNKELAMKEFAYIEFSASALKTNPFREYSDKVREGVIIQNVFGKEDWKPDALVKKGIEFIEEVQTEGSVGYRYWKSNRQAAEQVLEFLKTVDLTELNEKTGNPLYKPREILTSIADAEKTLKALDSLKTRVEEDLYSADKIGGGKTISPFAKGS